MQKKERKREEKSSPNRMRAHARAKFFSSTRCLGCWGGANLKSFSSWSFSCPYISLEICHLAFSHSVFKKNHPRTLKQRVLKNRLPPRPAYLFCTALSRARANRLQKRLSLLSFAIEKISLSLSLSAISSREREVSKYLRFLRERSALPSVVREKRERASNRLKKKAHVSFLDKNIDLDRIKTARIFLNSRLCAKKEERYHVPLPKKRFPE